MNGFAFIILPYFTILVFVLGMAYRLYAWAKLPQPGYMTLFPAPKSGAATFLNVVKESFFFPDLFKGDRVLWLFAWIFHASLALIIVGHLRVFTGVFDAIMIAMGINVDKMSAASGGAAGIIIFAAAILLLVRRVTSKRVREISNVSDFFALLLLVAVILTGNWMRFGEHFDLAQTRAYFASLLTFSFSGITVPQSGMFLLHFLLVQLLIIYIPFSKILHFGGIFFTQSIIQKS